MSVAARVSQEMGVKLGNEVSERHVVRILSRSPVLIIDGSTGCNVRAIRVRTVMENMEMPWNFIFMVISRPGKVPGRKRKSPKFWKKPENVLYYNVYLR